MTEREKLYEKISAQFEDFENSLKDLPPDKIIGKAYETVFKRDIVMCFEDDDNITDEQLAALTALEDPLGELYRNWLDTDVTHTDDLNESIYNYAEEVKRQNGFDEYMPPEPETPPLTSEPEPFARMTQALNGALNVGDYVITN